MSFSDEEIDDNNIFDQLKSIKAFTVDQLYLLHPDVGCPSTQRKTNQAHFHDRQPDSSHDQNLYQNLMEYEQLRDKCSKLRTQVKELHRQTFSHVDKIWVFKEEAPRKIGLCQQGKIAETMLKYRQASLDHKQIDSLNVSFTQLTEAISKDFIYYSFESQMKRNMIATHLATCYQIEDIDDRTQKIKQAISTMIDFMKHLSGSKSDFVIQCRKWLRSLLKRFLESAETDNYSFVISNLCKGPAGTADWSADIIECKPYEQVSGFDTVPQYITHCSTLLNDIFSNLRGKVRRVTISTGSSLGNTETSDQSWSLIDPRFSCSEEVDVSSPTGNCLAEPDVIKFCLKIPVTQIFRAYVKRCLESSEIESTQNCEYVMLKILTIGTIIIKTYQNGLETFNSIQYGTLIEYLSSQIRRTVIIISDQWAEFKRRLKGVDNALFMRLQVEYDNFILRSILIILELRQCGIWRHLSRIEQDDPQALRQNRSISDAVHPRLTKLLQVTGLSSHSESSSTKEYETDSKRKSMSSLTYEFSIEWFREVSEPMLWHILWQFYHSAFVSSCDYHSDTYWLNKFQEKSVIYLFTNKIRDSLPSECSYLLNSITSMCLSRTRQESKLVNFIATELFNLTFKQDNLRDKIAKIGIRSLIRCAEKFPHLISLFVRLINGSDFDNNIVELFSGCSLNGWICDEEEMHLMSEWLMERSLSSTHNKISRLLISKIFLNSPIYRPEVINEADESFQSQASILSKVNKKSSKYGKCFAGLTFRRKVAQLVFEASIKHFPEQADYGSQSLGSSVEVSLDEVLREGSSNCEVSLLNLAAEENYQQFYIWSWRLLFSLRLHILNQPETDWNDLQNRSDTSRSVRNTVLFNDSFHPTPSIEDSECLTISAALKNQNPIAAFVYLLMTDVTWQENSLENCLSHLSKMATSGHISPSLMAMQFLTICHIDDLNSIVTKQQECLSYFYTILTSNFDASRLTSLISYQMLRLNQRRQLQLSEFYITVFIGVADMIMKQNSTSWFSNDEHNLEKVSFLLDSIVRFNFTTQRLDIIRKFYDCSYSVQDFKPTGGWFGSLFTSNPANSSNAQSTRREFLTTLHVLTQKFKKYHWLRWITTECDTLRLEKIWEDIVIYLSTNEHATLDAAIRKVCPQINASILKSTLPIHSWIRQIFDIVETELSHPLCPLIWYNFYLNYFANSLNGVSVGLKLVAPEVQTKLLSRLDALFNYHLYKHRNWASTSALQQNSLAQLYRAYRLWLQDTSLQDAYVDIDRLRDEYLVSLLKHVIESSSSDACLQYIDIQGIDAQNRGLSETWSRAYVLKFSDDVLNESLITDDSSPDLNGSNQTVVDDEASDAMLLVAKKNPTGSEVNRSMHLSDDELGVPLRYQVRQDCRQVEELIHLIKQNLNSVLEESSVFVSNMNELDKIKHEILELIKNLYTNRKVEHIRIVPCPDGVDCIGPAKIKFEVEEATIDDRKSECIQDRQRQCEELLNELLNMPTEKSVISTVVIEDNVRFLMSDNEKAKLVIETLSKIISEPTTYEKLNGTYHAANNLLKTVLESLSNSVEIDTYNTSVMDACFEHPGGVQIFSPHLTPSACSPDCFLDLYKKISAQQSKLGPMAMFVLLSKFDINSWLRQISDKEKYHDLIKTTCSALKKMGKFADESVALTFDLYRRHLQFELSPPDRRRPEEIRLVLELFLNAMAEQTLSPVLWIDFMALLGLEKPSLILGPNMGDALSSQVGLAERQLKNELANVSSADKEESTISSVIDDVTRLADCQQIFDYHSIKSIVEDLIRFLTTNHEQSRDKTLLEIYESYLDEFGLVLVSVTFMWLRTVSDQYPDNHDLTWKSFMDIWFHWVYLSRNCQNISKRSYSLFANLFTASLRYMISKMPDNTQLVLQSTLEGLTSYVMQTKEVVYLELTILQRSLKNLPWSNLYASPRDFENIAILSEQENFNISDFISHLLLQIDMKQSLSRIHDIQPEVLPQVSERLATSIVIQSAHLKGFRLNGGYFTLIPVEQLARIALLILQRMEFANLEHSQKNKLLVNLLRFSCFKLDGVSQSPTTDCFDRFILYARFVSNYLVDLIKNHPNVIAYNAQYISAVIENSLKDLKVLLSPEIEIKKKIEVYEALLECCSSVLIDEKPRLMIAKSLIHSTFLKDQASVVMEVLHAIGHIISDGPVLVYSVEQLILLYLHMDASYEEVCKRFSLKVLPGDLYLDACVKRQTPLALLVYFEALSKTIEYKDANDENSHNNEFERTDNDDHRSQMSESRPFTSNERNMWTYFFYWVAQLSSPDYVRNQKRSDHIKLVVTWLRLLTMFEEHISQFVYSTNRELDKTTSNSTEVTSSSAGDKQSKQTSTNLISTHQTLVSFIKKLISLYDSSNSSGLWSYLKSMRSEQPSHISLAGLVIACFLADRTLTCITAGASRLSVQSSDNQSRSETAEMGTATPQTNKRAQNGPTLHLSPQMQALYDEQLKLNKLCLSKLEAARKSKQYSDCVHFIEAFIETSNRNDKVQYSDGVQLITTFIKSIYLSPSPSSCSDSGQEVCDDDGENVSFCLAKILPSSNDH